MSDQTETIETETSEDKPLSEQLEEYNKLTALGLSSETEFIQTIQNFSPDKAEEFIKKLSVEDLSDLWENYTLLYYKMRLVVERFRKARGKQKTRDALIERDRKLIEGKESENKKGKTKSKTRNTKVYDTDPALNKFIKEMLKAGVPEKIARTMYNGAK